MLNVNVFKILQNLDVQKIHVEQLALREKNKLNHVVLQMLENVNLEQKKELAMTIVVHSEISHNVLEILIQFKRYATITKIMIVTAKLMKIVFLFQLAVMEQ